MTSRLRADSEQVVFFFFFNELIFYFIFFYFLFFLKHLYWGIIALPEQVVWFLMFNQNPGVSHREQGWAPGKELFLRAACLCGWARAISLVARAE